MRILDSIDKLWQISCMKKMTTKEIVEPVLQVFLQSRWYVLNVESLQKG